LYYMKSLGSCWRTHECHDAQGIHVPLIPLGLKYL
jgi:hypothetical protein